MSETANKRIVVGVHLDQRVPVAPDVQSVFTNYGCYIKTRIGLHNVADGSCSPSGLILLEMYGDGTKIQEMEEKLNQMNGVTTKRMEFTEFGL